MKKLILVRHGKASKDDKLKDRDRPLKKRGFADAQIITKAFQLHDKPPFYALSSPATRALETARMFKENLGIADENFQIRDELYTFDSDELITILKAQKNTCDKMMVFGHNPAILETANRLGDKQMHKLPTTGLVAIASDVDTWADFSKGKTLLTLFPKMFK